MGEESVISFTVTEAEAGQRLDKLLARRAPGISRARFHTLIADARVRVNGRVAAKPSMKPAHGDVVEATLPPPREAEPRPQDIPLKVIYEDEHLIVIDKPPGMVVHPAAGHEEGTLVNALLHHCAGGLSGIGGVMRPGMVHRLDKDTSGLMVAAKSDAAHAGLAEQFAAHGRDGRLERAYLALVWGRPRHARGSIDAPLGRSPANRKKMAVVHSPAAREAITHYRVLESFPPHGQEPAASLVRCRLETGRTHQIRVHMAHIGHPVMGDETYGAGFKASANRLSPQARKALEELGRQALHAAILGFTHPASGQQMHFESAPPQDMQKLLEALRKAGA